MKLSVLIEALQNILKEEGDIICCDTEFIAPITVVEVARFEAEAKPRVLIGRDE